MKTQLISAAVTLFIVIILGFASRLMGDTIEARYLIFNGLCLIYLIYQSTLKAVREINLNK